MAELAEQIDIASQFPPLATLVKKVTWQRLGYLLEHVVDERGLADALYERLCTVPGTLIYMPLSTSAPDDTSERDSRWKINVSVQVETDDL